MDCFAALAMTGAVAMYGATGGRHCETVTVGRHSLPLRRNDNIRGAMDGVSVEMSENFEFCVAKLANSNCQDGNLNYSHPKVAGGLLVASKYSASTNGSSAIL